MTLRFGDPDDPTSIVHIGELTDMKIDKFFREESLTVTRLKIKQGLIRVKVTEPDKEIKTNLKIKTPELSVGVTGTEFSAGIDRLIDLDTTEVYDGVVCVEPIYNDCGIAIFGDETTGLGMRVSVDCEGYYWVEDLEHNVLNMEKVVINEVLTHAEPPREKAIELYNPWYGDVNIGGWFLSDDPHEVRKFRIQDGTIITANGYKVFYEHEFGAGSSGGFDLDPAHGGQLHLAAADPNGNLTGYWTYAPFGAVANGVSFGRYITSMGADFVPLSSPTFGVDEPNSLADFRTGQGAANADPQKGPVVISEIMYHPNDVNGVEEIEDEYLELYNISSESVALFDPANPANTWKLTGVIEFTFPENLTMAAQSRLLVVGFDPVSDTSAAAAFRSKYQVPTSVTMVGPFQNRLMDDGERIELLRPDQPLDPNGSDAGYVPYLLVEKVTYGYRDPWPIEADGFGDSLHRKLPAGYANDPAQWEAGSPSAGR